MIATPTKTANTNSNFCRVTKQNPCPICKKPDWCLVSPDGNAAICPRTEAGSIKRCGDAGWLHILNASSGPLNYLSSRPPAQQDPPSNPFEIGPDWGKPTSAARTYSIWQPQRWTEAVIPALAKQIGVSQNSLHAIGVVGRGLNSALIPERNTDGQIVGLQTRNLATGAKTMTTGSKRGLTHSEDWTSTPGPIVIVEGASDVAAGIDLGLCVIGRPSDQSDADGQLQLLIALAGQTDRDVIVLGENDQKPDGHWPGYNGAISVARKLAANLPSTRVLAALPPSGTKDLREWRVAHPAAKGKDFLSLLTTIETHEPLPPASLGTVCDCHSEEEEECCCTAPEPSQSKQAARNHKPGCTCEHCEADIAQDASERKKSCNFRRAIHKDGTIKVIRAKCKSWSCLSCRQILIERWSAHFAVICQTLDTQGEFAIYRHICTKEKSKKLLRAIREAGGSFIRVKLTDEVFAIYSTTDNQKTSLHTSGSLALFLPSSEHYFKQDLLNSSAQWRVVTTSRGWSMRAIGAKKCDTGWTALEGNFNSPEANKRACEEFHARYRVFRETDDCLPDRAVEMEIHLPIKSIVFGLKGAFTFDDLAKAFAKSVTRIANSWKSPPEFDSFADWSYWKDSSSNYPLQENPLEDNTTAAVGVGPPFF